MLPYHTTPEPIMGVKDDPLGSVVEQLERCADDTDAACIEKVLANAETVLRQRKAPLRPVDGKLVEVERPRIPSPTVDRRASGLRKDVDDLLREAEELRSRAATADPAAMQQRVHELAEAIQAFIDHEAKLVLQSVNTDIGGND
jgi:hypothetical protein